MVELFTNAAMLTEDMIRIFKRYPPVLIDISLYGATEKTYEKVTQTKNMYERVMWNCRRLVENNIRISLRTPVLRETLSEIEDMRKIAKTLGVIFAASYEISPTIDGDICTRSHQLSIKEILTFEMTEFFARGTVIDIEPEVQNLGREFPIFNCKMGKGALVIDYKGNMFPCMKFRHIGKKLTKDNFDDLWKSYEYYYQMKTGKTNRCNNCDGRYYCEVCPAEMELLYNNFEYRTEEMCKIAQFRKRLYRKEISYEEAVKYLENM